MDLTIDAPNDENVSVTKTISREDFKKLIDAVSIAVNSPCTDCDIVDGIIRQLNNYKTSFIQIDLTSFLSEFSISLSQAKQKVSLFKIISNVDESVKLDDKNVTFEIQDKKYKIYDPLSTFTLNKPVRKLLDNHYIDDEQFKKMVMVREDQLILSVDIEPYMSKRIAELSEVLNNQMIVVNMEGDKASIEVSEQNNENIGKAIKNIDLNVDDMPKCYFRTNVLPFRMDLNCTIRFSAYDLGEDTGLAKFDLTMDNTIPISIYSRIKFVK